MVPWRIRGALVCAGVVFAACGGDGGEAGGGTDGGAPVVDSGDMAGNADGGADAASTPADGGGGRGDPDAGGSSADGGGPGSGADAGGGADAGAATLSAAYPGDDGLGNDPAVVWFEDFEEGSTSAIADRYDQVRDEGRWELVSDTPNGSGEALAMTAGQGQNAVDLYKQLPGSDEWYVRWYAKYEADVPWHHSGMWFGGYNPAMAYPSPMAGNRPDGDDRFSIAIEPVYETPGGDPRFDFYNYWMGMHSWMEAPITDDGTAYYGNGLVHRNDLTVDEETWVCLEVHVHLNTDPSSNEGAVLEVWKDDELMERFTQNGPMGYWVRDKFCPDSADGSECTDYREPSDQVLDLQLRTTTDLELNAFWPQNYITDDARGTLTFDQMVVATERVGCIQ